MSSENTEESLSKTQQLDNLMRIHDQVPREDRDAMLVFVVGKASPEELAKAVLTAWSFEEYSAFNATIRPEAWKLPVEQGFQGEDGPA